jgi:Tfp pilus assembly protein PilO
MQTSAVAPRRQIPIRVDQLKRAPGLMVIGLPELIGLVGAALLALITLFAYFYFYLPAQSRLSSTQKEALQLQVQLRTSQKLFSETTTTSEAVDQMTASVKEFESARLAGSGSGRLSLYTELNSLIRSNGLRNTAGPSYTPLEAVRFKAQGPQVASVQKQGIAKWQSIYPGIAVSVTVEGPYQSVRHFVHDIEASRHFLIINGVELEGASQSGAAAQDFQTALPATKPLVVPPRPGAGRPGVTPPPVVAAPAGGRGSLVSLRLDMATYFQRAEGNSPTELPK